MAFKIKTSLMAAAALTAMMLAACGGDDDGGDGAYFLGEADFRPATVLTF